ncbi:amino acid aminotransferase [Neolewinella aurantiaca]|uniref:branched-chain-amino-acid transaminase n=1 Tax=Neolewinella aurantiaca TaxID=2602767 RepID=A0A5C7FIN7_9BACT|nr:aminotransferase class IV [Neolewinella aurantiaca]TXF90429.1 amino acid aminotransferase [Neolewinella aurantiaca]
MYPIVYLNGQYLPKEEADLNVADLAILRGFGIFDYFRYADGKPRFIEDHLDRFLRSAELLDLKMPASRDELRDAVHELIKRNGEPSGGIRFVLTGGYSPDGYTPTNPNLVAMAYPFQAPSAEQYEQGVSIHLHHYERQLPEVKSIDYLEGIRIQPMLKAKGADYSLYVDRDYNVRESDRSNFMIVRDGVLITPADNILLGITRKHLLRLARKLDIYVDERPVSVNELKNADEVIICSSTKGAMAITKVDGKVVGDGKPGPITRQLMEAWTEYVG